MHMVVDLIKFLFLEDMNPFIFMMMYEMHVWNAAIPHKRDV